MAVVDTLACFKVYDVRSKLSSDLNEDVACRIGRTYAQHLNTGYVVIGCDIRKFSESLNQTVANGFKDYGVDVIDVGMSAAEEIYFEAFHLDVDGGVEITATHNPMGYSGLKFVAKSVSGIEQIVAGSF